MKRLFKFLIISASSLFLLSGCTTFKSLKQPTIKISSQSTTESQILANIISELIAHETDYKTKLINNLGSSSVLHQSLLRGDADISASRYAGTEITAALQMAPVKDPIKAQKIVQSEFQKQFNQTWFPSYGFADTYAFMVTQETAKKYHLKTVSDLKKVSKQLSVGVDSVWMNHKGDGYKEFQQAYDITFERVSPMQIGLVYSALAAGKMDVVLGYSTDGRINSYDLKILKDDRQFFPPYDCSLVATNAILEKNPQLKPILSRLNGQIDLATMQKLNYQVDNDLLEPQTVAKQFLKDHDYFKKDVS